MHHRLAVILLLALPTLAAATPPASLIPGGTPPASVICVSDPAELPAALASAGSDGVANDVRLATGTHDVADMGLADLLPLTDMADLTLSGGWIAENGMPCARQLPAADLTVLDGNGTRHVLGLNVRFESTLAHHTTPH